MACLCDDLYNIKMDALYKISGKTTDGREIIKILDDSCTIKIQTDNKNQCLNESLETEWHVIYITPDAFDYDTLKVQRDEKKRSHLTVIPGDASGEILQSHEKCFDELEYQAIGIMTLRPTDSSGDVIVSPVDARIYVKDTRPWQQSLLRLKRVFGSSVLSSNDQKLKFQ